MWARSDPTPADALRFLVGCGENNDDLTNEPNYKQEIDDLREAPLLTIIELLQQRGGLVSYNDPFFPTVGQGHRYALTLPARRWATSANTNIATVCEAQLA